MRIITSEGYDFPYEQMIVRVLGTKIVGRVIGMESDYTLDNYTSSDEAEEMLRNLQQYAVLMPNGIFNFKEKKKTVLNKNKCDGMTNGQKIKNMSDEDFAYFLANHFSCELCRLKDTSICKSADSCKNAILEWLRQSVDF